MKLFLIATVFSFVASAYATIDGRPFNSLDRILAIELNSNETYQIGEEWGKKPVTNDDLKSDPYFRRMALATAKISRGATAFYLGEFNGKFVMATNHHVCPALSYCRGTIHFPILNITTSITEFYGSWPEVDLSLFAVAVNSTEAAALNAVASPFAFNKNVYHGELLVTIGFGIAENPNGVMMGNRDSDCKVYSADADYRLMGDPDALNPSTYQAWSFANGCDVSHGDSGSAMIDRVTGEVVGIIWTGRIPKNPQVQNKDYLEELFSSPNEDVWQQLSYSVPAVHIKTFLQKQISEQRLPETYVPTIEALLK